MATDKSSGKAVSQNNSKLRRKKNPLVFTRLYQVCLANEDGLLTAFVALLTCTLLSLIFAIGWGFTTIVLRWQDGYVEPYRHHKRPYHRQDQNHHNHHPHQGEHGDGNDVKDKELESLDFNPIYDIPDAFDTLGDRSSEYAQLRLKYDTHILPKDYQRSLDFVQSMTKPLPPSFLSTGPLQPPVHHSDQVEPPMHHSDQVEKDYDTDYYEDYDINNCPDQPPRNYPREWELVNDLLQNWPAADTNVPSTGVYQGLCVFDYFKEYDKALRYRAAELPFVVVNDPRLARTSERWHQPGYVEQMVGPNVKHRAEYNKNSHFMYQLPNLGVQRRLGATASRRRREELANMRDLKGRKAELQNKESVAKPLRMTFGEWLKHANATSDVSSTDEHWYFRLIACGYMDQHGQCDEGSTEALYDEMPFFQPTLENGNAIYMGEPDDQEGIHCRFGMKGVIAENHFDGVRNAIALMSGRRRYILSHPNQCENLAMLPQNHPSARHSAVDYTQPDLQTYPEFQDARANEVILQPGQVMYLSTNWFHYIVSLDLNFQCNARSGVGKEYMPPIEDCGFFK